jgi:S-adenosylmethionine:tRNA ribosyltransferase-isomerase
MAELFIDYELPPHLIAAEPAGERDQSRLLVVERTSGCLHHAHFIDLPEFLQSGDLVVLNNTRVLPARLYGRRQKTGGKWEGLFLQETAAGNWELLCQTRGWLQPGENIVVESGELLLEVISNAGPGRWLMKSLSPGTPSDLLEKFGHVPLPPYIRSGKDGPADRARYQTVYAERPGAVAAPTAGLHFTQRVFDLLQARGVSVAFVTLHVGIGTFQPIKADNPVEHVMHRETGELPPETALAIAACRSRGGRVVAVGTTSVRVLETAALHPSDSWAGETDLFIRPPYAFQRVGGLVTNLHLPKTSLLLLVQAFAGVELMRRAYQVAIDREYRFYSYGDAMLIL